MEPQSGRPAAAAGFGAPLQSKQHGQSPQHPQQALPPQLKRNLEVFADEASPQTAVGASGAEGDSRARSKVICPCPWFYARWTHTGCPCQPQEKSRRKPERAKGERLSIADRLGARSRRMLRKLERVLGTVLMLRIAILSFRQATSGRPRRNGS